MSLSNMICSCCNEIDIISAPYSGGDFVVKNLSTNEIIQLQGALVVDLSRPVIKAKNGESIKISFIPASDYESYTFDISYKLHNGTIIEKRGYYDYEYKITETNNGDYDVSLSAKSTEQSIGASRMFILRVTE